MKVYTRVEYQMTKDGMVEISSDYYEYDGPIAETKRKKKAPPPPPEPPPPPPDPIVVAQKKETASTAGRRRKGRFGNVSGSLLSGNYLGYGEDTLGS